MKKKKLIIILSIVGTVILLLVGGTFGYLLTYSGAQNVDSYFVNSETVKVENKESYYFFDNVNNDEKAFIFYPGAKVDERAYAPICREVADSGIDVFIMKMPFHMAIFKINAADEIYKNYSYSSYYLGGHSMGGASIGMYTESTSNQVDGVIMLAAFSNKDLTKKSSLKSLSIYGTKDGVLNSNSYNKYKSNLPNLEEVVIEGGNHAQFGSYGKQRGDNDATISLEEQTKISVNAICSFINAQ